LFLPSTACRFPSISIYSGLTCHMTAAATILRITTPNTAERLVPYCIKYQDVKGQLDKEEGRL